MAKADHTVKPTQGKEEKEISSSADGFTEKLKKLKSAYEANLISEAEYEEKKKEILNSF